MRRREFLKLIAGSVVARPLTARAQQPGKIYHIGFLANDPTIPTQAGYRAFLQELGEVGFIEGKNVVIEHRFAEAKLDRYSELAEELIRLEVDIIVTSTTPATLAAKRLTTKIPLVMLSTSDPVGEGIIDSVAHPGGNVTGLAQDDSAEISTKRLQLLKLAVPPIAQVAVLLNPDLAFAQAQWEQTENAAQGLHLELRRMAARQASDYEGAFAAALAKGRPDALVVATGPLNFFNRKLIMDLAIKNQLPAMSSNIEYAEVGGLLSYSYDRRESFRGAATYVVKILKGANPTNLPVELPVKYELVVNLKTARTLGLTLSDSFLLLADEVLE